MQWLNNMKTQEVRGTHVRKNKHLARTGNQAEKPNPTSGDMIISVHQ